MEWALHSTGYFSIISVALIGMGDIVTNEILEWFFRKPKIINASTIICRLMDDIISREVYIVYSKPTQS